MSLATFSVRAGISTFDLSRYIGASLTRIDRYYGHLARDGREHALTLLDKFTSADLGDVHAVDTAWTSKAASAATVGNGKSG